MTPSQQAYEEVDKVIAEQRATVDLNGTMSVERALQMCQRLMVTSWLRGHSAACERQKP